MGDVLEVSREPIKVDRSREYPNLGIYSFGRGLFAKPPIYGAKTSASTLYRVRAGQFIYSRLFAFEGAFGVVPDHMHGWFVSNEYPTFDVDRSQALVEYLHLAICRPSTWEELAAMTVGMGHRRQRLRPDDFLAFEIELPSLEEQQATVECVRAIDRTIAASEKEAARVHDLLRATQGRLDDRDIEISELADCVNSIGAGKSPKCEARQPRIGEWGVLKVSAIREGRFIPSEAKALPAGIEPFAQAEVRVGDVLVSRANTSDLVGAACRVGETPPRLLLSDKTLRLAVNGRVVDADYLVEALALPSVRGQIQEAATGSSASMKNISQDELRGVSVPLPSLDEQGRLGLRLAAIRRAMTCILAELSACHQLRSAFVEEVLTGESRPWI